MSNILMHYGVRGMKWRRRKGPLINRYNLNPPIKTDWQLNANKRRAGAQFTKNIDLTTAIRKETFPGNNNNTVNLQADVNANRKSRKDAKIKKIARRKVNKIVSSNSGIKVRGVTNSKSSMRGKKRIRTSGILSKAISSFASQ